MKNFPISALGLAVFLLLIFHLPIGHADSGDESWNQVFNFQLKLAERGNVKAQFILGEMYENGRGTEKNINLAISWYQKAKKNGHGKAAKRITSIEENIRNETLAKVREKANKKRREEKKARQLLQKKKRIAQQKIRQLNADRARAEELTRKKQEKKKKLFSPDKRAG